MDGSLDVDNPGEDSERVCSVCGSPLEPWERVQRQKGNSGSPRALKVIKKFGDVPDDISAL